MSRVVQETSVDAYVRILPAIGPLQRLAFDLIRRGQEVLCPNCEGDICPACGGSGFVHSGGFTNKELVEATGIQFISIAPRVTELKDLGLVQDSGRRRSGSIVWILTDVGKEYARGSRHD